jgi:2-dehydro-3-deoxygluconokinase
MPELVTFGETMLRLSAPDGERLSRTDSLDVHVGGAESNVAVAAANLGVTARWLSKLPNSPLGQRVVHALRGEGVVPEVVWTAEGRVGTYYLEAGGDPRGTKVVYDRAGAAIRTAATDELPLDRIERADAFYTSGITPALSGTLVSTTADLLTAATAADTTTVFDLNYRAKLWSPDRAKETIEALLPAVDVLFVAERDARNVLGLKGEANGIAAHLLREYDLDTAVITRGELGAVALHDGVVHEQPVFEAETRDAVGTGDAFVGGFLARRLRGGTVSEALEDAAAAAALKRTLPGDMATLTPDDVASVVDADGNRIDR